MNKKIFLILLSVGFIEASDNRSKLIPQEFIAFGWAEQGPIRVDVEGNSNLERVNRIWEMKNSANEVVARQGVCYRACKKCGVQVLGDSCACAQAKSFTAMSPKRLSESVLALRTFFGLSKSAED